MGDNRAHCKNRAGSIRARSNCKWCSTDSCSPVRSLACSSSSWLSVQAAATLASVQQHSSCTSQVSHLHHHTRAPMHFTLQASAYQARLTLNHEARLASAAQ